MSHRRVLGVLTAGGAIALLAGSAFGQPDLEVQLGNITPGEVDYQSIQQAITNAVEGDEIWVYAPGPSIAEANGDAVYTEVINFGTKNLVVRGKNHMVRLIPTGLAAQAGVVEIVGGQTNATVFQSFIISTEGDIQGHGMYISGASPVIHNVEFTDLDAGAGAGIFIVGVLDAATEPHITYCDFYNCDATFNGGAVYVEDASPYFDGMWAEDCDALPGSGGLGGVLYIAKFNPHEPGDPPPPILSRNSWFFRNSADLGGAVFIEGDPLVEFRNSWINDNDARQGGGIYSRHVSPGSLDFVKTSIEYNVATEAGGGVALYTGGPTSFVSCRLDDNAAYNEDEPVETMGGAVMHSLPEGTGDPNGSCTIVNTQICDNNADVGSSVYAAHDAAYTRLMNTTIADGWSEDGRPTVYALDYLTVQNSIVYHNSPALWLEHAGTVPPGLYYSDLEGQADDPPNGVFSADPTFISLSRGDLRLHFASTCRDLGDNDRLPADWADLDNDGDLDEPIPYDRAGDQRINGLGDPPFIVDLGCYELGSEEPCSIADLAPEYGVHDLVDITAFIDAFMNGSSIGDLDDNGILDLNDVTAFIAVFLAGCP